MQWIKHENQNSLKTVVTEIDFFLCSWEDYYGLLLEKSEDLSKDLRKGRNKKNKT